MRSLLWRKLGIIFLDFWLLLLGFCLAYFVRLGTFTHGVFPFGPYFSGAVFMVPIWIFFLAIAGRYSVLEKTFFEHIRAIFLASVGASLFFPLLFYFQNELFFSRGIVFLIFLCGVFLLFVSTFFERMLQKWEVHRNKNISRLLVIGANRSAEKIIHTLLSNFSRQKPVAILAPYGSKKKEICSVPLLGKLDALERITDQYHISEVFLCEGAEHSMNILSFCETKGLPFSTSAEALGIFQKDFDAQKVGDTLFLVLQHSPLFGWGQFFKRAFDIVVSAVLIVFVSPFFAISSVYTVLKQLQKVFLGEMSIVGPIFLSPEEIQKYFPERLNVRLQRRFLLRPGMRGPVSQNDFENDSEKALEKEIRYIQTWSLWKDAKILFS